MYFNNHRWIPPTHITAHDSHSTTLWIVLCADHTQPHWAGWVRSAHKPAWWILQFTSTVLTIAITLIAVTNSHTSSLTHAATATQKTSLISSSSSHTPLLISTLPNATLKTSKPSSVLSSHIKSSPTLTSRSTDSKLDVSTSTVLASSPPLGVNGDPTLQSSYSFLSTDLEPDVITAPGPLLAGVLSVVGILCIAAVITVVVLIVVIRRRKKATMTVKNERFVMLCACTTSWLRMGSSLVWHPLIEC